MTRQCVKAAYTLENKLGITNFRIAGDSIIRIYDPEVPQGDIVKAFILEGVVIDAVNKKVSSLKEYFFNSLNGGAVNA